MARMGKSYGVKQEAGSPAIGSDGTVYFGSGDNRLAFTSMASYKVETGGAVSLRRHRF